MPAKAKSKAQARFLGGVAGGAIRRKGLSAKRAREMLKGTKVKKLPARKRKRRTKRKR
jgi:hypothetical protein